MPRVTLFRIVSVDSYSDYQYNSYEIMTSGSKMVEVTDEELKLLEEYCIKNKNKKFILAVESNEKIPFCIDRMMKDAEKWKIENKKLLEKQKEKELEKKQKTFERKKKQLEKLKKELEEEGQNNGKTRIG